MQETRNPRLEEMPQTLNIARTMNAADVIHEIESMPEDEKGKVIDFVRHLAEKRYEEEQILIAEKRLEDYDKGIEGAVEHVEAMRRLREG